MVRKIKCRTKEGNIDNYKVTSWNSVRWFGSSEQNLLFALIILGHLGWIEWCFWLCWVWHWIYFYFSYVFCWWGWLWGGSLLFYLIFFVLLSDWVTHCWWYSFSLRRCIVFGKSIFISWYLSFIVSPPSLGI
jgi:hypothetical protein